MSNFQSVASLLSPADAARYTGRYETEVPGKDGKAVKVTRSVRKADLDKLLLSGSITPTKAPPLKENAVDDLCGMFESKVAVTKTPKANKMTKSVDSIKVTGSRNKSKPDEDATVKAILRSKKTSKVQASSLSPIRRSRRLSGCAQTRSTRFEE